MPKSNRGKSLWREPSRARGTCPVCLSTRIKLLYTQTKSDGTSIKVCKRCSNASKERIDAAIHINGSIPFRRKHRAVINQLRRSILQ